jgi:hypothetical protein
MNCSRGLVLRPSHVRSRLQRPRRSSGGRRTRLCWGCRRLSGARRRWSIRCARPAGCRREPGCGLSIPGDPAGIDGTASPRAFGLSLSRRLMSAAGTWPSITIAVDLRRVTRAQFLRHAQLLAIGGHVVDIVGGHGEAILAQMVDPAATTAAGGVLVNLDARGALGERAGGGKQHKGEEEANQRHGRISLGGRRAASVRWRRKAEW